MSRIILVIPTLTSGGAERVVSILANEWVSKHEVHLILLAKAERFYELDNKVVVYELGFENKGNFIKKAILEFRTYFKLRNLFFQIQPDSVLSFMAKYNVLTLLASVGLGLNVFVSDRSNPYAELPWTISKLRKYSYPFASGIIAQTEAAKKVIYTETKHRNILVIPNPVSSKNVFKHTKKEKIIINVGRLVPEKGQKLLISAFAKTGRKDWLLVILGEGPLKEELERHIDCLGLSEKVILVGKTKNVDEWFAKSSFFVLSSVSEGFPNVLLEAMAAGLPCVSFNCPVGPSEIINDGVNGLLVEPMDSDVLAQKMLMLIDDADLRSALVKNVNLKKYNVSRIGEKYLQAIGIQKN